MNERMKLKIERELWPQCIRKLTLNDGTELEKYFDKYKFAELIVKECAKVSERTGALNECNYEGEMIADTIKEHFGVEE